MEESIGGQKVVAMFRRSAAVASAFRAQNEEVYGASIAANTFALLLMPLISVLGNLMICGFAVVLAKSVLLG